MHEKYSVGGRTAATAATATHAGGGFWNPSSTRTVFVVEVHWAKTVATADHLSVQRTTARGTASSTVTPDADNDWMRDATPPSGAVLDVTYSAQPTLAGPDLLKTNLPAAVAAGVMYAFGEPGIRIPPGTGLAFITPVATILQPADLTVVWLEM